MTEYTITLPEKLYRSLLAVAQAQGISPVNWIALQLPQLVAEPQPLTDLLAGLIGAIDSQAKPHHTFEKTTFGETVATKLAKQGIHRP